MFFQSLFIVILISNKIFCEDYKCDLILEYKEVCPKYNFKAPYCSKKLDICPITDYTYQAMCLIPHCKVSKLS